jgi:hypothetical protein
MGAPESLRTAVLEALATAYRRFDGPDGVTLPGANWIVAAKV